MLDLASCILHLLLLLSALFQRPATSHDGSPGDAHACTAPRITHRTFSSPSRRRPRRPLSHGTAQYSHLLNENDVAALEAVQAFNPYDLYSKSDEPVDPEKLKPYYQSLIAKFFPSVVEW